jgi:hypothetical protein
VELTRTGRSGICRRRFTGAHFCEVTAIWLNVSVALAASDTVELQGNFTGEDGFFAADHTRF